MPVIRITKEFRYESSHLLKDYDGLCRNIHGHSYRLLVTVMGKINTDSGSPKNGMVMDFGELKEIVHSGIIDVFDHSLIVNGSTPEPARSRMNEVTGRVIFTPYQPTCENLVVDFAERIKKRLPPHLSLFSLRLYETGTSYSEWFATDNDSLK